jgi:hypothetical protein
MTGETALVGWDVWYFGFKNAVFHKGLVVREGEVPPATLMWAGIPYVQIGLAQSAYKAYYKVASSETVTNVEEAEAEIFAQRLLNGPIAHVDSYGYNRVKRS